MPEPCSAEPANDEDAEYDVAYPTFCCSEAAFEGGFAGAVCKVCFQPAWPCGLCKSNSVCSFQASAFSFCLLKAIASSSVSTGRMH